MSSLSKDLSFLILQFLDEGKLKETVHQLEQESGLFFNVKYVEDLVLSGQWDIVEKYLSGFTKVDDNEYSMKIYFEIRKQKYLEALDKHDRAKAVDILVNDLKVFSSFDEDLFNDLTCLLPLDSFREKEMLACYRDAKSARTIMMVELKKLIEANPIFCEKLQFPEITRSRLRTLINQSLNFQHSLCSNPKQNPDVTLFVDHTCRQSDESYPQLNFSDPLMVSPERTEGFLPRATYGPSQPTPVPVQMPFPASIVNPSNVTHPIPLGGSVSLLSTTNPAPLLNCPGGSEDVLRTRPIGISDRITLPVNTGQSQSHVPTFKISDGLPKTVGRTLNQGSSVMSMDFHPVLQILLLVGTSVGDIVLWDVVSQEKLVSRNFKVWDIGTCSMTLEAALIKDPCVSVNRILWSPNGALFGVAYSKHIVQLYFYYGGNDFQQNLELDAHAGSVNDIAFANPKKQLCVITCGDDKIIKVWDVVTGAKKYNFEGHEAPVYSVCPHNLENVHFILSTSVDGKIKRWFYDILGPMVDCEAPGRCCTKMAYSTDGKRLFSCGTSKYGESFVVEWSEDGVVERVYQGLGKYSSDVIQFDTSKNRFLVVGADFSIKCWDMDNVNLLTSIDADGDLTASPRIRFSKDGMLLAVSANENRIKILGNAYGLWLLRSYESNVGLRTLPKTGTTKLKTRNDETEEVRVTEISGPSQLRSLKLPVQEKADKILRLTYTNSGTAVLALASNAIHLLWKWKQNNDNSSGKATTKVSPQLWQPPSGIMTNDVTDAKPEEAVPCFALSKNDYYVVSASGGKISLFNMQTFKTMTTFMSPPPAATYLIFCPQDNNIIAVGMDDSTIHIYKARVDEVIIKLKGHCKRITGLVFSHALNLLVSSGADTQIITWNCRKWERQCSRFIQIPAGMTTSAVLDTQVHLHQDQMHFLSVHATQLAIYKVKRLQSLKQWTIGESSAPITHATFSCDSNLVYASFQDGSVCIFSASILQLRYRIKPTSYLLPDASPNTYPLVIAAHPQEPNQFTLGLTDGGVHLIEPLKSEAKWHYYPTRWK